MTFSYYFWHLPLFSSFFSPRLAAFAIRVSFHVSFWFVSINELFFHQRLGYVYIVQIHYSIKCSKSHLLYPNWRKNMEEWRNVSFDFITYFVVIIFCLYRMVHLHEFHFSLSNENSELNSQTSFLSRIIFCTVFLFCLVLFI